MSYGLRAIVAMLLTICIVVGGIVFWVLFAHLAEFLGQLLP